MANWFSRLLSSKPASKIEKKEPYQARDFYIIKEILPLNPISGWNAKQILHALEQHDLGNFAYSELLYHAMTKETRIGAALESRVKAIRQYPFCLEIDENAPPRMQAATRVLQKNWHRIISRDDQSESLERLIMMGFCVARHHLESVNGQIAPVIKPWTHSGLQYNPSDRLIYAITEKGDRVPVQGDPWIIFTQGSSRPWLKGSIRKLAFPFFMLSHAWDRWAAYNDTEAQAIRKIKTPALQREQEDVARFTKLIRQLRGGDTMIAPEGYDLELLSVAARGGHSTFMDMIHALWDSIAIELLGHNLNQDVRGGSRAAAQVGANVLVDISEADVCRLTEPMYDSTTRIWTEANFTPEFYGETSLVQYRPRPIYKVEAPADQKQLAETASLNAQATKNYIDAATAAGVDVLKTVGIDWRAQAKQCGFALLDTNKGEVT